MSNDTIHVSQLSIDELLVRALDQGNGASRHEIKRRQIELITRGRPISLADFLYEELARSRGTEHIGASTSDLDGIKLDDNPDMICTLARRVKRDGFCGQGMRDQPRAKAYIDMAASNPRVMDELPASGLAFWKSAEFHYRLWKVEQESAKAS